MHGEYYVSISMRSGRAVRSKGEQRFIVEHLKNRIFKLCKMGKENLGRYGRNSDPVLKNSD